jgi:hypothetical protein
MITQRDRDLHSWDKAVEKLTELTYNLNAEQNSNTEIEIALEDISNAIKQLNKFWEERLRDK